jgi:hypothetical protein
MRCFDCGCLLSEHTTRPLTPSELELYEGVDASKIFMLVCPVIVPVSIDRN